MRLVVLHNPASLKNSKKKAKSFPDTIKSIDLISQSALPDILRGLFDDKIDCIIIDGGDGTVREVLTHLPDIYCDTLPLIGILPNGNTNLIAHNVGAFWNVNKLLKLQELSKEEAIKNVCKTPLLRLGFEEPARPVERGFIMGWGAYAKATEIAHEGMATKGAFQVLSVILKILKSAFLQGQKGALRQGVRCSFCVNGKKMEKGQRFIGLATTLKGPLRAGLNPFWGGNNGTMRWTDVLSPASYLFPFVFLAIKGWPIKQMAKAGYRSGHADRLELVLDTSLVLDGEFIEIENPQKITISADETINFISM